MTTLLKVRGRFQAAHKGVFAKQVHGHAWEVTAWFTVDPPRDARVIRETLHGYLKAFDHSYLDEDFIGLTITDEGIATFLGEQLSDRGCVKVEIWRPVDCIGAEWTMPRKMRGKTAYLCGPINGCTDEEANGWRSKVKELWPGPTIDPMARDYRGREMERGIAAEIVEGDKDDIDNCDVVIVSYDKPSVGTSMEVIYAWERGKRVVVVHREGVNLSPWLIYHSHARVHSYADAVAACL